ncbi:MAG: TlpA family protein disulfide reductase [Campylobacterales bacterium]|nr:TlpA family protein disulfide reductase [Campylobacterales bacterium]
MKRLIALISVVMLYATHTFALGQSTTLNENLFQIKDVNGNSYTIEALPNGMQVKEIKDKVVFLEFFGHRCPPCMKSIPKYIQLQEKYKDKLAIVAIEVQGLTSQQTAAFVKEKGINYITVSQMDAGMLTEHIATRASWSGAIPFLIILDQKGEVQTMQAGLIPTSALENIIETLTKETNTTEANVTVESNVTKK